MNLIINKKVVSLFLWGIILFILTRQIPFSFLSPFSNIALVILLFLFLSQTGKEKKETVLVMIWILLLVSYSLVLQNDLSNIFRFSLIVVCILASYYVSLPIESVKIFFFFLFLQSLLVIILEVFLLVFVTMDEYLPIRTFLFQKGWGDIYTYSGNYYFIQIKGCALILFAYMLTYVYPFKSKRNKMILRVVFLLGVLFVGNFSFLISLFCFHFFKFISIQGLSYKNSILRILSLFILVMLFTPSIYTYVDDTLERKSEVSLGTRSDQVHVLMEDLDENLATLFLGQGLGHTLSVKTPFRDYTGDVYFELQSVFFLNQLGLINFMLFIVLNIYLAIKKIRVKPLLWIYFCYVIYGVTNPYILDTNQIIVIITLISVSHKYQSLIYRK